MTFFEDDDPEDSYDVGDPLVIRLEVLRRWVFDLQLERLAEPSPTVRFTIRRLAALATVLGLLVDRPPRRYRKQLAELRTKLDALP